MSGRDEKATGEDSHFFFDLSLDMLCIANFEGFIIKANAAWQKNLGWSPEQLYACPYIDFVHPDDVAATEQAAARLAQGQDVVHFENRYRHHNGSYLWLEWNCRSVPEKQQVFCVVHDVSDRKRRLLLMARIEEDSGVGSWEIDLNTEEVYWSEQTHRIHGTDPAHYQSKLSDGISFYAPEAQPVLREAVSQLMQQGQGFVLELPFITAQGQPTWVRTVARADVREGKVLRVYGTFADISQERQERQELLRFRDMVELAQEGVWECDGQGLLRYVNRRFADMLEQSPEALLGQPVLDYIAPFDVAQAKAQLCQTQQGHYEIAWQTQSGRLLWTQVATRPRSDSQGRLQSMFAVVTDVSALKLRETMLSAHEALLENISRQVPGVIYTLQLDGQGEGRFLWISQGVQGLYGINVEEARADIEAIFSRVHPEDREAYLARSRDCAARGVAWSDEFRIVRSDGEQRWIRGDATPELQADGSVIYYGYVHDISDTKQVEHALRESRQRMHDIIRAADVGTWEWHLADDSLQVNARWAHMLGYNQAELEPISLATWWQLTEPEDAAIVEQRIRSHLVGASDYYACEFRMRHKQGHWVWVMARGQVVGSDPVNGALRVAGTHQDISERKRIELELQRSKTMLESIFASLTEVVWSMSMPEGKILFVTPSIEKLYDISQQRFLEEDGEFWTSFVHPDDRETIARAWQTLAEQGHFTNEYRIITPRGQVKWLANHGQYVYGENGQPQRIDGIITDISARKQVEIALRESEARYQSVVQTQQEMICRFKPDATLTFVNDAYCKLLGQPRDSLLGRQFLDFIPEAKQAYVRSCLAKLIAERQVQSYEHETILTDGSLRWQRWADYPIVDAEGALQEIQSVGYDITERKQAEMALQASEEKFRSFVENANDIIFTLDRDAKMSYISPNWETILGYPVAQWLHREAWDLFHPDDIPAIRQTVSALYQDEQQDLQITYRVRHADGSWRWHSAHGSALREGEAVYALLGIARDVTETKMLEQRLRDSEQQLRSTLASMDDLVFVLDAQGVFREAYHAGVESQGFYLPTSEFLGRSYQQVLPADLVKVTDGVMAQARQREAFYTINYDYQLSYAQEDDSENDSRTRWFSAKATVRRDEAGNFMGITVVSRDISERKRFEQQLQELATTDPLTGLWNRRYFSESLEHNFQNFLTSSYPQAVMMLDIDYFKRINDSWGHDAGDLVLKTFAELLRSNLRKHDIAARLGGEEFAVLLPQTSVAEAQPLAERLRHVFAQSGVPWESGKMHFTVSIGLTMMHADDASSDTSLIRADRALYAAKQQGRNRVESC